jgi:proteasome accessory factor C
MADTAATQLKRLLTLIPRLADNEEHPIADVATIVGVTPEQLIDDLQALVERFDAPGGFVDGVQIYQDGKNVSVVTQHFLRPMRLTMSELCALELGLAIVRSERAPEDAGPADRALERLRGVITQIPGDDKFIGIREASLSGAPGVREHLDVLKQAVREHRKVRLLYKKGGGTAAESRTICPYTLVHTSGMWYVVAHCERAKALRVFRLDRVLNAEAEVTIYEVPKDFSVDRVMAQAKAFIKDQPLETLRVRYSPRIAKWIAEREGKALSADGSLEIEHPLADRAWAVRHVLQYGPEAEVLAPAEVRAAVQAALERMIAEVAA